MDEIEKQIIDNEIERYMQKLKNSPTVHTYKVGHIEVKEYDKDTVLTIDENKEYYFKGFEPKTEEEIRKHKALEEYKQKFLADIEKLKKEKPKNKRFKIICVRMR